MAKLVTKLVQQGPVIIPQLKVTVINGDLSFVRQPFLMGHYRSLNLTGTEYVMNRLIGGTMEASLSLGLYPVAVGTHQVFINHIPAEDDLCRVPRPEAVIVVGLGEEGKLRASDLLQTVRQATLAWAQRSFEKNQTQKESQTQFELAATLIGSGGLGVSAGQSAQVISQAVYEANQRLAQRNESLRSLNDERKKRGERLLDEWPMVGHLFLTEVYLDRAREAWRALQVQATATGNYDVTETVQPGQAALPRPIEHNYRGADYDFMSAVSGTNELGDAIISFTLDTKRARSEVHAESAPRELVRNLLRIGWNEAQANEAVGHTLFKLLIPIEMESFLSGSSEMQIELDSGTAGIPWELLDTRGDGGGANPWAIRTKLLRKLRTAEFRLNPRDASASDGILIVGEPDCDPKIYPPLLGARNEAVAVRDLFLESRKVSKESIVSLIHPEAQNQPGFDACKITSTVISGDWRIVHIAGHGEPPAKIGPIPQKPGDPPQRDGRPRGVVLSDGLFLGPDLIQKMRPVPELVFVNCCHLAARNPGQLLNTDESLLGKPYDRASFASGVAEELIKLGVRCVIAAGWAVGDQQAMAFATTFYNQILGGERFLDAVDVARQESRKKGGNTWAAYQCYGDPDWRFRTSPGVHASGKRPKDEFAGIASPQDLVVALTTLAVESEFRKAPREQQLKRLTYLRDRFAGIWNRNGQVAEAFGKAFAVLKQFDDAIDWYGRAMAASDGSASMRAAEQLGNLRVRLVFQKLNSNVGRVDTKEAIEKARNEINDARTSLELLANDAKGSAERQNLCGSAWKRIALIERLAEQPQQESEAIQKMHDHYLAAEKLAREANASDVFYPALNRLAANILLNGQKPEGNGLDQDEVKELREQINSKLKSDPDFWSTVGLVELQLYEALAQRKLAGSLESLKRGFNDVHSRVTSLLMWSSVNDQAQFVLNGYARNSSEPQEKDAAHQVLELLEQMAGK